MRVAFYILNLSDGGAERVMASLANIFSKKGHDVYVITSFSVKGEYELNDKVKRIVLDDGKKYNKLLRNIVHTKNCAIFYA